METRNQAKKTGVGNRVSNKSAPSVSDLLCNKNGSSTHKNAPVQQLCRETPPTQKASETEKRKKPGEDTGRKEPTVKNRRAQIEESQDHALYKERLEIAKREAVREGRFKVASKGIREDGTWQLEGVDRGCSPSALGFEMHDDLSGYASCTPQRVNVNCVQPVNTEEVSPRVEIERNCTLVEDRDVEKSQECRDVQTYLLESPQISSVVTQLVSTREDNIPTQVRTNTLNDTNSVASSTIVNSIITNPNPSECVQSTIQNASTPDIRHELVHPVPSSSKTTGTQTDPSERMKTNVSSCVPNSITTTTISQCDATATRTEQIEVRPTNENLNQASTSMHVPSMSLTTHHEVVRTVEKSVATEGVLRHVNDPHNSEVEVNSRVEPEPIQTPSVLLTLQPGIVIAMEKSTLADEEGRRVVDSVSDEVDVNSGEKLDLETELNRLEKAIYDSCMLEHHLAFTDDCIKENVYPLGMKAYVPCAVFKANDALKKEWKRVLHTTSLELLALCKRHYSRIQGEIKQALATTREMGGSLKGEDRIEWEMRECAVLKQEQLMSKQLGETRKKKIKRTKTIHNEGRIFTEYCLVEQGPTKTVHTEKRGETDKSERPTTLGSLADNHHKDTTIGQSCSNNAAELGSTLTDKPRMGEKVNDSGGVPRSECKESSNPTKRTTDRERRDPTVDVSYRKGRNYSWVPWGRHNNLHPWWKNDRGQHKWNDKWDYRRGWERNRWMWEDMKRSIEFGGKNNGEFRWGYRSRDERADWAGCYRGGLRETEEWIRPNGNLEKEQNWDYPRGANTYRNRRHF